MSGISEKTRVIATAEIERLKKAEKELAAIKRKQKIQVPIAIMRLSKYEDYTAYIQFIKKDDSGRLLKDDKGFYTIDKDLPTINLNTTLMKDLLEGTRKAVVLTNTEDPQ